MAENNNSTGFKSEANAFFDQHSPKEARAKLWEWFTIAVTGHFDRLSVTEKEDLVTFYEQVRDLVEGLVSSGLTETNGNKQVSLNHQAAVAFFDEHSLEEAKAKLWEWFTVAVTGHFDRLSVTEKEDLVTFYEQVRDLVEGLAPSSPKGGAATKIRQRCKMT